MITIAQPLVIPVEIEKTRNIEKVIRCPNQEGVSKMTELLFALSSVHSIRRGSVRFDSLLFFFTVTLTHILTLPLFSHTLTSTLIKEAKHPHFFLQPTSPTPLLHFNKHTHTYTQPWLKEKVSTSFATYIDPHSFALISPSPSFCFLSFITLLTAWKRHTPIYFLYWTLPLDFLDNIWIRKQRNHSEARLGTWTTGM